MKLSILFSAMIALSAISAKANEPVKDAAAATNTAVEKSSETVKETAHDAHGKMVSETAKMKTKAKKVKKSGDHKVEEMKKEVTTETAPAGH